MSLIHLNWNLDYSCTSTNQSHCQEPFQIILLNSQVHKYPTINAQDYSIHKAKKVFSDRAIRKTGPAL